MAEDYDSQVGMTGVDMAGRGWVIASFQLVIALVVYHLILSKLFDDDNVLQRFQPARVHLLRFFGLFQGVWLGFILIIFGVAIAFPAVNLFGPFSQAAEQRRRRAWARRYVDEIRPRRFATAKRLLFDGRPPRYLAPQ